MATGVAEVGSLFPRLRASIWGSCWQKVHRTVARDRFAFQNVKKLMPAEHFCRSGWQNVHGTVARARFQKKSKKVECSEPEQRRKVCTIDAEQMLVDLVDLVRRSCFAGLQPVYSKSHWQGCAQESAGLQL